MDTINEVKSRGLQLLDSFVAKARLEMNVMARRNRQVHLEGLHAGLATTITLPENYPNKLFNGLAEAVARCLILYEEKPDAYAQLVRGFCEDELDAFLDTFEGLRTLHALERRLSDDHDYLFNEKTQTIEVQSDVTGNVRILVPQSFLALVIERSKT